ncbi:sensor histidine kinase [Streptomyces sp. NPDC059740]|uniref:sensor histidine kinase n=1 Tax=Streptomyces sp. NPDC059740 TaxID=3346926 RepID=UPI0036491F23
MPLRSRLAMLTAAAVAIAVALCAAASWAIVRDQLNEQLDSSLRASSPETAYLQLQGQACSGDASAGAQLSRFPPTTYTVQLVSQGGDVCTSQGKSPIPATAADKAVAQGVVRSVLHTARAQDGREMRVWTQRYQVAGGHVTASLATPTDQVDRPLDQLALILLIVAGVGVLCAATTGLWVAQAGLRPVDRLAEAVEHVARTEDLGLRIPVEGEDEIARLSRSFNAMTAALASSRDLQQQLIADAGHELRTPLTSMRTNIDLLVRIEQSGRQIPAEEKKALLDSVKAQMVELATLIGDLQELSRTPGAGQGGHAGVVALHETVRTALRRARLRGPHLDVVDELDDWYVLAEPAALERAVVNLLDNAVKFSPEGGTVEVRLRQGVLTVRDHGPGIPAEDLPHVFERFWRSPSARSLPGSGLGLSIVARTVAQAGGTVRLRAAEGGGTEAVVQLPGAPTPPPQDVPRDVPQGTGPAAQAGPGEPPPSEGPRPRADRADRADRTDRTDRRDRADGTDGVDGERGPGGGGDTPSED